MTRDTACSTRRAGKRASAGGGTASARALGGGTLWLPEGLAMTKSWHFCSHTARDVPEMCADTADLEPAVGIRPRTPIGEGVRRVVDCFLKSREKLWFRASQDTATPVTL